MNHWLLLLTAIVTEVFATSLLKISQGFTRLLPTIISLTGYAISFYFLSLTLKTLPVGIAYAVWSGVGIVLITAIAWIGFEQKLDMAALAGMGLIILGVVVIHVFSETAGH